MEKRRYCTLFSCLFIAAISGAWGNFSFANVRPVVTVVRNNQDVAQYMDMMKSIIVSSVKQTNKYRFIVITTSSTNTVLSRKWQDSKWFMRSSTVHISLFYLPEDELTRTPPNAQSNIMIAYATLLQQKEKLNLTRFAYVDVRTRFRGSLDELWDEFRHFTNRNWISAPTNALAKNLDTEYCKVLSLMPYWMKEYQRLRCEIAVHIALFDLANILPNRLRMSDIVLTEDVDKFDFNYNPGFYSYPSLENIQTRWIRDKDSFAILPCQWSSYEGCPPSASGAMHPDVTPSARYLAHESYLNSILDDEMLRLRPFPDNYYACVQQTHILGLVDFNEKFLGEAAVIRLSSIISPLMRSLPAGVVVDVGASVGTFIERIGVMDHFEYHLFEPSPPHYSILNQKYSTYSNIHITTKALSHSNHSGTQSFFFNPDEATTGRLLSDIIYIKDDIPIHRIQVPVTTLDSYFESVPTSLKRNGIDGILPYEITLLKTDTEGYDTLILLGGENTLKKTGMVIFECHLLEDAFYGGPGTTQYETAEYLWSLGFRVFKIGKEVLLEYSGSYYNSASDIIKEWSNCMALRKGHPWESTIFSNYMMMDCSSFVSG